MKITENKYVFSLASELEPRGWLRVQLETEAKGLAGNLDKVWPDVRDSRWIGGTNDGWERVPYWLDGFVPLAFLLHDEDMIARAKRYIYAILDGQKEDGWLCPCGDEERAGYDMWALWLIGKVLTVYADCCPEDEERVKNVLLRAFRNASEHIKAHPLFRWAQYRWFEALVPVFWLYERTEEEWLLDFADLLYAQGRDYVKLYREEWSDCHDFRKNWEWDRHVVNQGMALKADCLWQKRLGTPNEKADEFCDEMYKLLQKYHGMPTGHFTGDECLAGNSPVQGSELCSVVEAMYSYEWNLAVTGNPVWGDRLERTAFNALPATTSADMWTHQYDQQTNQIACAPETRYVIWTTNNPEANMFGLEPQFGCCTANMPQGWPKFALSVFMKSENAILSAVPSPAVFRTSMKGTDVKVTCETRYPFGDAVLYTVETASPVSFSLDIRIPSYAVGAKIDGADAKPGTIVSLDRTWEGKTEIRVSFAFEAKLSEMGYGDYLVVNRGPLLFSLPLGENKIMVEYTREGVERKFPYCDYVIYPTTPWNYAFASENFTYHACEDDARLCASPAFDPDASPVSLEADLVPIRWDKKDGYMWVVNDLTLDAKPIGEPRRMTLIPYGCTDLRMTAMPHVK